MNNESSYYIICPSCKSKTTVIKRDSEKNISYVWCNFPIKTDKKRANISKYLISVPKSFTQSDEIIDSKLFIEPLSGNIGNMGKDIIIPTVNAVIDRWISFRQMVPVMRIDFETAEHVLYHSECFQAIYEEITGVKVDRRYPTDEYLSIMEISAHMMTVMTPQFRKEHIYKNTMNRNKLLEIYSQETVKIPFSIAGIVWNLMHPEDRFTIKLFG